MKDNAAAMRNALLNAKTRFASLALMNSEWRTCAESHIREIDAALSTPARNCDIYRTLAEAVLASGEAPADAPGLFGMSNAQLVRFCKWLFATAKGGAE